jgi:putative RecB family exonuclease
MAYPVPVSLSPTAIGNFTQCAKLFQFANIERIEQPPTVDQVRGIIVHDALFRLFWQPGNRNLDNAEHYATIAVTAAADLIAEVGYSPVEMQAEVMPLVDRLYELEAPASVTPVGLELKVSGSFDGTHMIRGIIDRLELEEGGTFTVTDYKTGKAPSKAHLFNRLRGVMVYANIVEDVFGINVGKVQLYCLGGKKPQRLSISPTDTQMEAARRRVNAAWVAVEDGCQAEHFIANPGPLCGWCAFRDRCPTGDKYLTERGK